MAPALAIQNRRTRVALVGDIPRDLRDATGGVQTATMALVAGLRRRDDIELHVISCLGDLVADEHPVLEGAQFHFLATNRRFEVVTRQAALRRRLVKYLGTLRPDLVHAVGSSPYGYACLRVWDPTIVTLHGIMREDARYFRTPMQRLRGLVAHVLCERAVVRRARHLIVISSGYVRRYFGASLLGRLHDIANPVSEECFLVEGCGERDRILLAGALNRRKRAVDMIRAMPLVLARRPEATLRIVGPIEDRAYHRSMLREIEGRGLGQRVVLLGGLDQAGMLEELRRSTCLVLCSGQETSPMVIAEAMAAGRPVVATRVGGVPELVEDGRSGFLVDVGDLPGLAGRIVALLDDPAACARMGERGRDIALARFHADVVAARTLAAYQEVLDARSPGASPDLAPAGRSAGRGTM